jgi:hypothetical protein
MERGAARNRYSNGADRPYRATIQGFLFREVKYELSHPIVQEIRQRLASELTTQMKEVTEKYRVEIETLKLLREAGVIRPYRQREIALRHFASAIDAETNEIIIIGSSLRGLLQQDEYHDIAEKLKFKIHKGGVAVKFLLTHPVVSDLRARQENRGFTEIGKETVSSLLILKQWNVPHENVRLYRGTPTCFAIKTKGQMFLNPYPYMAVAFDSPCLIVETSEDHPSYFLRSI